MVIHSSHGAALNLPYCLLHVMDRLWVHVPPPFSHRIWCFRVCGNKKNCVGGWTRMSSPGGSGAFKKKAPLTSNLLTVHRLMAAKSAAAKMLNGSACAVHRWAVGSSCWKFPTMHSLHLRWSSTARDHTLSIGNGFLPYVLRSSAVATWTASRVRNESCSACAAKIQLSRSGPTAPRPLQEGPRSCQVPHQPPGEVPRNEHLPNARLP